MFKITKLKKNQQPIKQSCHEQTVKTEDCCPRHAIVRIIAGSSITHTPSPYHLNHNRPHPPRRQRGEDAVGARDKISRLQVEKVDQALIRP